MDDHNDELLLQYFVHMVVLLQSATALAQSINITLLPIQFRIQVEMLAFICVNNLRSSVFCFSSLDVFTS